MPECVHWMKMQLWHKPITLIGAMWCNYIMFRISIVYSILALPTCVGIMQTKTTDWRYIVLQVIVCPSLIYGFWVPPYVPLFVITLPSFPYAWLTKGCFTIVIWWVPLMGRVQLYCSEHITVMNSHRVYPFFDLLNPWLYV